MYIHKQIEVHLQLKSVDLLGSLALNYIQLIDGGEPECYNEAMQDENLSKWELAMKDELDFLLGNQTWELTELPTRKKALHNK